MFKKLALIGFYFTLSSLFTWWFIAVSPLYISFEQMLWSCGIAGGKWMIQLLAGFVFLKERKWDFIARIGFVCFIGSLLLIPYAFAATLHLADSTTFFIASLVVAVLAMIFLYQKAVQQTGLKKTWWYAWLICLAIAVSLQLTVVFNVVRF